MAAETLSPTTVRFLKTMKLAGISPARALRLAPVSDAYARFLFLVHLLLNFNKPRLTQPRGKIQGALSSLRPQGPAYTVSLFGQIALAGAFLLYVFSTTFTPAEINSFITMTLVLLGGVVMTAVFVGIPRFVPLTKKNLAVDAISTATAYIAIYYVNKYVPYQLGLSPISERTFAVLAGVAEEWMFRMWLCAWIYNVTGKMWIAVPISSFIWAVFHTARYGMNPGLMLIVFLAGLPLGFLTLALRSPNGPTFAHMLVNFISVR
jgi:hypothetical protein